MRARENPRIALTDWGRGHNGKLEDGDGGNSEEKAPGGRVPNGRPRTGSD